MTRRPTLAIALCAVAGLALLAACGGDDDDAPTSATSTNDQASGDRASEPVVPGPASKYSLLLDDLQGDWGFRTDVPHTYVLKLDCPPDEATCQPYGKSPPFSSPQEGRDLLEQWGYEAGFETSVIPDVAEDATLRGAYFVVVETHLFDSAKGAEEAYAYLKDRIDSNQLTREEEAPRVGNDSAAWTYIDSTIPGSNVNRIHHQVLIRRGNVVAAVKTVGAQPLMKATTVNRLATIIDNKVLGTQPSIEPTPTGNFTPPVTTRVVPRTIVPSDLTPSPTP